MPIDAMDEQMMLRPRAMAGTLIASSRVAVRLPRKNGESESSVVTGARDAETSYVSSVTDDVLTNKSLNPMREFSHAESITQRECQSPSLGVSRKMWQELWQQLHTLSSVTLCVL